MICLDLMAAGAETTSTTLLWIGKHWQSISVQGSSCNSLLWSHFCSFAFAFNFLVFRPALRMP